MRNFGSIISQWSNYDAGGRDSHLERKDSVKSTLSRNSNEDRFI